MIRHLLLVRHGKSSWAEGIRSDAERPLNARGEEEAPLMAQRAADLMGRPDLLMSSPALRAAQTAKVFANTWGMPEASIRWEPKIYEAHTGTLQGLVELLPDDCSKVAVFGHNPGFTSLANLYAKNWDLDNLPTCGMVLLGFMAESWQKVGAGTGEVLAYETPKMQRG